MEDESRLTIATVHQAKNTDNCQLHQQGMPASDISHYHQWVLDNPCQGAQSLVSAQPFYYKHMEEYSWFFYMTIGFT